MNPIKTFTIAALAFVATATAATNVYADEQAVTEARHLRNGDDDGDWNPPGGGGTQCFPNEWRCFGNDVFTCRGGFWRYFTTCRTRCVYLDNIATCSTA